MCDAVEVAEDSVEEGVEAKISYEDFLLNQFDRDVLIVQMSWPQRPKDGIVGLLPTSKLQASYKMYRTQVIVEYWSTFWSALLAATKRKSAIYY